MIRIVYDRSQMKVGCAILQGLSGGDNLIASRFDVKDWLTAPTDNMKLYSLKDENELQKLIELTAQHHMVD